MIIFLEKNMAAVIFLSDFDGTATKLPGNDLVYTEFYQSLLRNYVPGQRQNYKRQMISMEERQKKFEEKFNGPYDPQKNYDANDEKILLNADAVAMYKELLSNPDVRLCFITKNQKDYIESLFLFHGFSKEEISRLDVRDSGNKYNDAKAILDTEPAVKAIYVLDDNEDDYDAMHRAATEFAENHNDVKINAYHHAPGDFKWRDYHEHAKKVLYQQTRSALEQNSQLNHRGKTAVMSIQSLDKQKIALHPTELDQYEIDHPGVKKMEDGHTGFAMAKVLNAPFAVLRSTANREHANEVFKDYLGDNSLLVITGHGLQDGETITGTYIEGGIKINSPDIERKPEDIVGSVLEAGLQPGTTITILLCVCYGASDTKNTGNSFAHKLAREFAKHGISTTIIASEQPVKRFGTSAIGQNQITFDDNVGMAPEHIQIFTTKIAFPNDSPDIQVFKTDKMIQLANGVMQFINVPEEQVLFKKQLHALEKQIDNLKARRDRAPTRGQYYPNLDRAYREAKQVHDLIKHAGCEYFAKRISFDDFKERADKAIKQARPVLREHRGIKGFLEAIMNFFWPISTNKSTLFKLDTESIKRVNALEDSINNINMPPK